MNSEKPGVKWNPVPAILTVFSAFTGIRKGAHSKQDQAKLSPLQIILAAVICVACLITVLVLLVRTITR
ncbi:DUF2970 domain-containing protein [Burkholderiaceae bacterium DAT-1]|nr:DUF2970 domain-containing protein [Burkholderiaceae bacterium DAT-1]